MSIISFFKLFLPLLIFIKRIFSMWWKKKNVEIPDLKLSVPEIKQKAKILFIDNEEVALVEILQSEGWHVEEWRDVRSLTDLEAGKFDLIFLDIGGVGKQFSPTDEGFGILQRVKNVNPSVLIVAYSGMTFDATKAEFWKHADGILSKSSGAIKAIELMEGLLQKKFNSLNLWSDLESVLKTNNVSSDSISKIKKTMLSAPSKSWDLTSLKTALKGYSLTASTVNASINIINKIVDLMG